MVMQEIEFISSLGMPPTRHDEIFRMVSTGKLEAMMDFETVGIPVIDDF